LATQQSVEKSVEKSLLKSIANEKSIEKSKENSPIKNKEKSIGKSADNYIEKEEDIYNDNFNENSNVKDNNSQNIDKDINENNKSKGLDNLDLLETIKEEKNIHDNHDPISHTNQNNIQNNQNNHINIKPHTNTDAKFEDIGEELPNKSKNYYIDDDNQHEKDKDNHHNLLNKESDLKHDEQPNYEDLNNINNNNDHPEESQDYKSIIDESIGNDHHDIDNHNHNNFNTDHNHEDNHHDHIEDHHKHDRQPIATEDNPDEHLIKKGSEHNKNHHVEDEHQSNNVFNFYTDKLEDFEDFYHQYVKTINEEQRIGFNFKHSLSDYIIGINPKIITIKDTSNKIIGLVITTYENTTDNILNLVITHFSIINFDDYERCFVNTIKFIKRNIRCDQILVNIYYDSVQNELNPALKNYFKNIFKFKLKKVENLKTDRVAKFVLIVNEAINELDYMDQPTINAMNYKINTILGIWESVNVSRPTSADVALDKNVNFFNILLLICEMISEHNKYTSNSRIFENQSIREMSNMCTKFLNIYLHDKTKLKANFAKDHLVLQLIDKFNDNLAIFNADVEMSLKFQNVFTKYLDINNEEILYYRITVSELFIIFICNDCFLMYLYVY